MNNDFDIFAKHTLEVHTTELTASCMKAVQLRHEGKVLGETGQALFKGVVGQRNAIKKAIITLKDGETLNFFDGV